MRSTILGFNQNEAIELGLKTEDLLILDYIIRANGTPSMHHIVDDSISYVWLSHKKIHEDLPILNMAESTLKNKLSELKKLGLIDSKHVQNTIGRGSQTFYSVTDKTIQMTTYFESDVVERPRTCGSTSYNSLSSNSKLTDNTIINNSTGNDFLGQLKQKTRKKSLYEKCYDDIIEFTTNVGLIEALNDYLKIRLQMKDKPLYEGTWKGMLKKLSKMDNQIDVVNESIERGWASFFEHKDYKKKGKEVFGEDDNIISEKGEFDSSGETF